MSTNGKPFGYYLDKMSTNSNSSPLETQSGMYSRDRSADRPQESSSSRRLCSMIRIPQRSRSVNDLRKEFNQISDELTFNFNDLTYDKMGHKLEDMIEKKANQTLNEANGSLLFPPPLKRKRKEDIPLIINGIVIPRKDALTIGLVLNNKTTLDSQLSLTKHPVIGLDFVIEYIDPDNECPRVYHCRLCKQFNTYSSVMEHLTGYNHRVRYIASKYPNEANMYLMPNGITANRNSTLIRLAQARAAELETVYGRGEFEVRHERPTIPKETKFDKESDIIVESGKQTQVLKDALQIIRMCKLESEEDVRLAKKIINDLTDAILNHKQTNVAIDSLISQGRSSEQNSDRKY